MKKYISTAVALALSSSLFATQIEVTPTAGLKLDDRGDFEEHSLSGIKVGAYVNKNYKVEFAFDYGSELEYKDSKDVTDVYKYSLNSVYLFDTGTKISPFIMGGAGYEDYSDRVNELEEQPFLNYGAGLKYKFSETVNAQIEFRHFYNLGQENTDLYANVGIGFVFGATPKKEAPIVEAPKPVEPPKVVEAPKPVVAPKVEAPKPIEKPKDSDKDGVLDVSDKCPDTRVGFIVDKDGCDKSYDFAVYFDTAKYDVKGVPAGLQDAINLMNQHKTYKAMVYGHADIRGNVEYNRKLSHNRVDTVIKAMTKLGIDKSRMVEVKSFGKESPVAPNDTADGMAKNRVVIIKVVQ